MLGLFTALRTLPLGPEYDDERIMATLTLMEYLSNTGRSVKIFYFILFVAILKFKVPIFFSFFRQEQYIEYVHQLREKHLTYVNVEKHMVPKYAEAGCTLLLHANLLDWSDKVLPPIPSRGFPEETSFERKVINRTLPFFGLFI